jgi:hypothetical protein
MFSSRRPRKALLSRRLAVDEDALVPEESDRNTDAVPMFPRQWPRPQCATMPSLDAHIRKMRELFGILDTSVSHTLNLVIVPIIRRSDRSGFVRAILPSRRVAILSPTLAERPRVRSDGNQAPTLEHLCLCSIPSLMWTRYKTTVAPYTSLHNLEFAHRVKTMDDWKNIRISLMGQEYHLPQFEPRNHPRTNVLESELMFQSLNQQICALDQRHKAAFWMIHQLSELTKCCNKHECRANPQHCLSSLLNDVYQVQFWAGSELLRQQNIIHECFSRAVWSQ